jgi:hypothetical protein
MATTQARPVLAITMVAFCLQASRWPVTDARFDFSRAAGPSDTDVDLWRDDDDDDELPTLDDLPDCFIFEEPASSPTAREMIVGVVGLLAVGCLEAILMSSH